MGERMPGGSEHSGRHDGYSRHRPDGRDALGVLLKMADREAPAVDERRRLDARVAAAVVDAGFARHFVPVEWGGAAGSFARLIADASAVAEACAATGWCAALYAAHGRLAAYLPERGQREVWSQGPDVRIAASVVPPQGSAAAVPGGWRLDGEWRTASGVDHAEWVLLASWTPGSDGAREHRVFAVPRAELTVRDTWDSVGLRGSGSNSVAGEGITVPAHRSFTLGALLRPLPGAARCHRVPYPMVAAPIFAAPVLGRPGRRCGPGRPSACGPRRAGRARTCCWRRRPRASTRRACCSRALPSAPTRGRARRSRWPRTAGTRRRRPPGAARR